MSQQEQPSRPAFAPAAAEMNINVELPHDLYRTLYTSDLSSPSSSSSSSSSSAVCLTSDAPVYRGTVLHEYEAEQDTNWEEARHAKELSLPALLSSSSSSSSSSSFSSSFKPSSLPDVTVVTDIPARPLSPVPSQYERDFSLLSSASSSAIFSFLLSSFSASSSPFPCIASMHPSHPAVCVSVNHQHLSLSLSINLFAASSSSVLVEFQRRSGDLLLFHQLYSHCLQAMQRSGLVQSTTQSHSLPVLSSLSPPALGGEDDMDDEELEKEVMALYRQQAMHSEQHHTKRTALLGLLSCSSSAPSSPSSSSPAAVKEEELLALLSSSLSSHDVREKELTIALVEQQIACIPLSSPLFSSLTPLLVSAASSPAFSNCSSVWWQRGVVRVLFVCSNAVEGRRCLSGAETVSALDSLRSATGDEEVKAGVEQLRDCLTRN